MDRVLPDTVKRKRTKKVMLKFVVSAVLFFLLLMFLRNIVQPSIRKSEFYIAVAEIGDIQATVSASGTVLPEFEEIKTSPIQSTIKTIYRNTGDTVEPGDSILFLDTKTTKLNLEKLKDQLALRKNSVNQLELQLEKALIDLRTQYEIKKLHVESMEAELNEEKYLNQIGGSTKEKIEKAELNLKIAKLELLQIEETIINKEKSMLADLKGLNYEINIQQKNVKEINEKLKEATVKSDKKGVITWLNSQIGQTVSAGEELVKIANLESYNVEGTISGMHASKLYNGCRVLVRINKDVQLAGQIVSISPSIANNIIQFKIKLENKNHPLLRPNLKVDVSVETAFRENVVRVKNGPFYKGGTRQKVFVVKKDKLVRKETEFGNSNFDHVQVLSGLVQGEKVVISDMSEYENHEILKIK
ncbi:efflux RND transporter periplasmic adaptor subunit [candidate division KSB1 bacterium]|nr:efflux RND transporter periplasmic adaptor subunit [candidate division KSB1 bacterium]